MKTTVNTVLALAMKEIRAEQGYNQKAMADLLGMTSAGWGKVENGLTTISVDMVFRFGTCVNWPPSHILEKVEQSVDLLKKEGFEFTATSTEQDSLLGGYSLSKASGGNWSSLPSIDGLSFSTVSLAATIAKSVGKIFD
ncbi:helix-turn-helix domain-containing protein [Shewanella indica]